MKMLVLIASFCLISALMVVLFNFVKQKGVDQQKLTQFELLLEDKENDQKISSGPIIDSSDLLIRMRTENN